MVSKQAGVTAPLAALVALVLSGPLLAGTITGGVAFPGDSITPLTVVADDQTNGRQFTVATRAAQPGYRLDAPAGRYVVFAIPRGPVGADKADQPPLRGAYSAFSLCVLGSPEMSAAGECTDHRLLAVDVGADETRNRIDLYDWYLPQEEKARILAIEVETP